MSSVMGSTIQRRRILVQGIVQGVGFRPFVYGQALLLGLVGFVRNDSQGVTIEIEGSVEALDGFQHALNKQAPPLARIDAVATELIPACHENSFSITHSQKGAERHALISPDSATCDDCLRELFDPADRRYRYAFINCTNCGPRFTIVQDVPYDREKTTMQVFPMCPACKAEYGDPLNRRFHAQPNACPFCGPHMRLFEWSDHDSVGASVAWTLGSDPCDRPSDPVATAAQRLAEGAILAIKGLGGYHLACDALNAGAVRRLRQRKHREAKPFALMVPDLETARALCEVSVAEAALLQSRRRPIVLLEQRTDCPVAPGVAPSHNSLGIMLPYTPLHHLLLRDFAAVIEAGRPEALVMTSGNLSDEPIAYRDDDARERLASIADGMLTHNRDIHMRCDDSVMRTAGGGEQFLRRSRGYAPEPVALATDLPVPLLACGGHLKNTFCLGKGRQAFVSHHIGDLENLETLTSFREGIEHFQRLFDIYPQAVAYDLHPEYLATKYALDADIARKIAVQHHHAHIASVLAEHGLSGPVIGIAADGTGFGTDGAVWGCEIMAADLTGFERLAHLTYVPLPGGEQAVRQPWRMAATYLAQAYGDAFLDLDIPFVRGLDRSKWHTLSQMIARGVNCPPTSSLGRLFDAVAALLGVRDTALYEGQAAIELEMLAVGTRLIAFANDGAQPYPFTIQKQEAGGQGGEAAKVTMLTPWSPAAATLDVAPMIRAIVSDLQQGLTPAHIASRFHCTIAWLLAAAAGDAREMTGLNSVALSGGVFQNRLLLETLIARLEEMGFQVHINRRVPPNDGGLSLGQLAVAAAQIQRMEGRD
ncbi:MAG TPA: carbamoyltransferase HypF [Ktedonobacteraceae bacterium]|nr:carbamoyltransferase HypF [Ktedonobacteraceae bacterium]